MRAGIERSEMYRNLLEMWKFISKCVEMWKFALNFEIS